MEEIQRLQEEFEHWKKLCDDANRQKIAKKLEAVNIGDEEDRLSKEMDDLQKKKKNLQEDLKEQDTRFSEELLVLKMRHDELKEEEDELQKELNESDDAFMKIQENLLVNSQLPQKNLNFKCGASEEKQTDHDPVDIMYSCQIVSSPPYVLGGGQALLTFEEEQVAKSVIAKKRHLLDYDGTRVNMEAAEPTLGKSVKFEVKMNISSKKIKVSNLPKGIPEDVLKDRVELYFYKSGIGGGEIEEVDYDKNSNTACVTYLQNGVAQRVLKKELHEFRAGGATCEVAVMPCGDIELNKLQMFSAASSRTVLLTGIRNFDDAEEDDVQDILEIHFQKESNGGGEVEKTLFCKNRRVNSLFEEDLK